MGLPDRRISLGGDVVAEERGELEGDVGAVETSSLVSFSSSLKVGVVTH